MGGDIGRGIDDDEDREEATDELEWDGIGPMAPTEGLTGRKGGEIAEEEPRDE